MPLAGGPVWNICAAATLPTDPHPPVEFVKINWSGEHQESGGDLLTGLRLRSSAVLWRCSTSPDR
jgi:hypothetical protein